MGLIREVQQVSYHMTKTEQTRKEREKQKSKENDLKRDLKSILKGEILSKYYQYNDWLRVYESKEKIISKTIEAIKEITEDIEKMNLTKKDEIIKKQKYIIDDFKVWDMLDNCFYSQLMNIKKEFDNIGKLEREKNDKILKNLINNKLKYYFYDWLQSGYSKEQIFRGLNDSEIKSLIIDDIMSEQQDLEIKKDNIITLYQKQLKEFKIQHKDDAEPPKNQEKATSLALPWKILLFNKAIKTILKGL